MKRVSSNETPIDQPLRMIRRRLEEKGIDQAPLGRTLHGIIAAACCLFLLTSSAGARQPLLSSCEFWVAPPPKGSSSNPGTSSQPWEGLETAVEQVPDDNCMIWVKDGIYTDHPNLTRRFETRVTIRAEHPYRAIFEHNDVVLSVDGGKNITIEGFEFRHRSAPSVDEIVVAVSGENRIFAEGIIIRNNIIHDSYNNDLLKLYDGVKDTLVENNVFYNSGPYESHMDVNSVSDVFIQDNIYFQDYSASGRQDPRNTKQIIIIKDSGEDKDGMLGSRRVTVQRNIFLNWEGTSAKFLKVGNDGKPFHEGIDIRILNNLFLGNSDELTDGAFGVSGGKDITFANNTVVGNLPGSTYAFVVDTKGANPDNENIYFYNNIWSDPTGTMGSNGAGSANLFAVVEEGTTHNLVLDNNLYWNGSAEIPVGIGVDPSIQDFDGLDADPILDSDYRDLVLPVWNGETFLSGSTTVRQEFVRLAMQYARISPGSPAVNAGSVDFAPEDDILGRLRRSEPDIGAYEYGALSPYFSCQVFGFQCSPSD